MTNKKKNIKTLVHRPDYDEALNRQLAEDVMNSSGTFAPDVEVDTPTFDAKLQRQDIDNRSRAELEITLREQLALNEAKSFEIEKLHSIQRGLSAELVAREEIAANVASDFEYSRQQVIDAMRIVELRDEQIRTMQSALEEADRRSGRLLARATRLKLSAKEQKERISSLEASLLAGPTGIGILRQKSRLRKKGATKVSLWKKIPIDEVASVKTTLETARAELDELRSYIDRRKDAWSELNEELAEVRRQLEIKSQEAMQLSREADEGKCQLATSEEKYNTAAKQLSIQKSKILVLNETVHALEHALHHEAKSEIAECRNLISKQSGELATLRQELSALRHDNARIEQYSDVLRMQVNDREAQSKASIALQQKLTASLDAANEAIINLSARLEAEKQLSSDYLDTVEKLRRDFANEIRQVRFELGAAEETIAGQEALNEQLVSNLIDTQGFRLALESQLEEIEEENEKTIRKLTSELKHARDENEDYNRKLTIKDSAIAELIEELSNHTSNIEIKGEVDNVLRRIDGFRPKGQQSPTAHNRTRVARLLRGKADGRELRFPLFKDRLTIGRTAHNDIQLDIQYVSRRHAVISTENGATRVVDWGSKNGVFVNGNQVSEQILLSGDILSIGMADFTYEERIK